MLFFFFKASRITPEDSQPIRMFVEVAENDWDLVIAGDDKCFDHTGADSTVTVENCFVRDEVPVQAGGHSTNALFRNVVVEDTFLGVEKM